MPACPFCPPDPGRVFHEGELTLVLWDAFPVSPGHALIVTRRHVASWFEATAAEQTELMGMIARARDAIVELQRPAGFNLGINIGDAAGQTVPHLHLHVIPRFEGDVVDPRGGVRYVIPDRANYQRTPAVDGVADAGEVWLGAGSSPLVRGEADPLLPHLRQHFARALSADLAVAFVQRSGVDAIRASLHELVDRGGRLRLVTGDYLGITDPDALRSLLDVQAVRGPAIELRVFESNGLSFHPKAYLFRFPDDGIAYIGSSNLTGPALTDAVEWNYRVVLAQDRRGFSAISTGFDTLFRDPRSVPLNAAWVEEYRRRRPASFLPLEIPPETPLPPPTPHPIQIEALDALARTREEGQTTGLVVMATGLGKTWLAAFDFDRFGARRALFVAHRDEILRQALDTFRRIRPRARLGYYTGEDKTPVADVLFASIQTLGRPDHLARFAPDAFDYIVVDEFHHAAAKTYRRLITHFEPRFLLGLTATPERTDGGDLLSLCSENLVYRCDLFDAIRRTPERLVPFHYFGVPDQVDYENIPWRSHRFEDEALTRAVATEARAANALEQWRRHAGPDTRTIGFCCSTAHADFMAGFFRGHGLRAAAVHSGESSAPRHASLVDLAAGSLDVVFAVDILNEGIDIPRVDTVLMLRPTESRVVWLQQLGRGLRRTEGKSHLTVVDYIGNHRSFLLKPQALFALLPGDAHLHRALAHLQARDFAALGLPPGCEVTYELQAIDILRALLRAPAAGEQLRFWYEDARAENGARPTAVEAYHQGLNPTTARPSYGSWLLFVESMGDLGELERAVLADTGSGAFLEELEKTAMDKSFKMLTVLAMLDAGALPGRIGITDLIAGFRRQARRNAHLRAEVSANMDDDQALRRYLEINPIAAWCRPKGATRRQHLHYEAGVLTTTFTILDDRRAAFEGLAREIVEWRLASYLSRKTTLASDDARIVCKVIQTGGRPILKLPDRKVHRHIPEGWLAVTIDDAAYEAKVAKEYVNVVRRYGSETNVLAELARGWFGEGAGQRGTSFHVAFVRTGEAWSMIPLATAND